MGLDSCFNTCDTGCRFTPRFLHFFTSKLGLMISSLSAMRDYPTMRLCMKKNLPATLMELNNSKPIFPISVPVNTIAQ